MYTSMPRKTRPESLTIENMTGLSLIDKLQRLATTVQMKPGEVFSNY